MLSVTEGKTLGDYSRERLLRQGVERNLQITGEAVGRLRRDDPETADRLSEHERIVGFRNVLVSETRTGHKFELPKSGKGRSIKLSRKAVEALRSHRAGQAGETTARLSVARRGSRVPDHDGHDHEWNESSRALLQAALEEGGSSPGKAARPTPHLRYNTPHGRQASHLLPRNRGHGRWPRRRHGRGALSPIAAALLPPGILADPGCGVIRIHKPMRP